MVEPTEPENSKKSNREKTVKAKRNKEHIVKFRVSEEELQALISYAQEHKSVSDFIRYCCLKQAEKNVHVSKKVESKVEALTKQVNAIGKNINQVARYVNFLEDNGISYAPSIERFNSEIGNYAAKQIKIEALLKQILKD